jgi:hypothetical protein
MTETDRRAGPDKPALDTYIAHAREVLASQIPFVDRKKYDFVPQFRIMTTQLFMIGSITRLGENLGLPGDTAREQAFAALHTMLVRDGMAQRHATKMVTDLRAHTKAEDGSDALAIIAGYESSHGDGGLAKVLDEYLDEPRVSGKMWRLYNNIKRSIIICGGTAAFLTVWFVTIFMPESSSITALAAGLGAAAIVIIPIFLGGQMIYRKRIRQSRPTASGLSRST